MLDQEPRDFEQETEARLYTERVDSTFRWLAGWIGGGYLFITLAPILRGLTPLAVLLLCVLMYYIPTIRKKAEDWLDVRQARKEVKDIDSEVLKW